PGPKGTHQRSGLSPTSFRGPHSFLEDLVHAERGFDHGVLDHAHRCRQRDSTDDLRRVDLDPAAFRLVADRGEDFPDVRYAVVGEVHRHLDQAAVGEREAESLDVGQTTGGGADGFCDVFGDLQVGCLEVDVVGDQRNPRPDRRRPGSGVDRGRSFVRGAVRVADVLEQILEASLAYLFQLAALGPSGGLGIVIDRDSKLFPESRAESMGKVDANTHRQVGERNEGHNVGGTHPWVFAAVLPQIDAFGRNGGAGHRRIDRKAWLGDEGDDHPVMRGIGLDVDYAGARRLDRIRDLGDDLQPATLREIRDALYEGCQTTPPATVVMTRFTPT